MREKVNLSELSHHYSKKPKELVKIMNSVPKRKVYKHPTKLKKSAKLTEKPLYKRISESYEQKEMEFNSN